MSWPPKLGLGYIPVQLSEYNFGAGTVSREHTENSFLKWVDLCKL